MPPNDFALRFYVWKFENKSKMILKKLCIGINYWTWYHVFQKPQWIESCSKDIKYSFELVRSNPI